MFPVTLLQLSSFLPNIALISEAEKMHLLPQFHVPLNSAKRMTKYVQ
jgi:hypothetical protein